MDVIFLAYRDWAVKVLPAIEKHPQVKSLAVCRTQEELRSLPLEQFDLLITVGWSQELGPEIANAITAIGVHCAELDRYSYGTPIQNQILDGIRVTKHRIFKFTAGDGSPRAHTHTCEYSHEVPLDLSGNMEDILEQMTATSKVLFNMYLNDYPNVTWRQWEKETFKREPRVPKDSRLTKDDLLRMTASELYDFMRCLESPYPNAYLEDETGRLFFNRVSFKKV